MNFGDVLGVSRARRDDRSSVGFAFRNIARFGLL